MASPCEDCCGPGGCGPGAKPSRVIDFGVPAFDRRGTVVMEDGSLPSVGTAPMRTPSFDQFGAAARALTNNTAPAGGWSVGVGPLAGVELALSSSRVAELSATLLQVGNSEAVFTASRALTTAAATTTYGASWSSKLLDVHASADADRVGHLSTSAALGGLKLGVATSHAMVEGGALLSYSAGVEFEARGATATAVLEGLAREPPHECTLAAAAPPIAVGGGSTLLGAVLTVGRETKPKLAAGASWTTALGGAILTAKLTADQSGRAGFGLALNDGAPVSASLTVGAGGGGAVSAVAATVLAERSHVVKLPFGVKVPIKLAPEGVQATVEKVAGGEKKVW